MTRITRFLSFLLVAGAACAAFYAIALRPTDTIARVEHVIRYVQSRPLGSTIDEATYTAEMNGQVYDIRHYFSRRSPERLRDEFIQRCQTSPVNYCFQTENAREYHTFAVTPDGTEMVIIQKDDSTGATYVAHMSGDEGLPQMDYELQMAMYGEGPLATPEFREAISAVLDEMVAAGMPQILADDARAGNISLMELFRSYPKIILASETLRDALQARAEEMRPQFMSAFANATEPLTQDRPGRDISDISRLPNSIRTNSGAMHHSFPIESATYVSALEPDEAVAWYRGELQRAGYEGIRQRNTTGDVFANPLLPRAKAPDHGTSEWFMNGEVHVVVSATEHEDGSSVTVLRVDGGQPERF